MRKIKKWIITDDHHVGCNMFLLTILCHGNKHGHLLDKHKNKGWDTEEFVADLSEVETLIKKPKVIIMQACRGSKDFATFFNEKRYGFTINCYDHRVFFEWQNLQIM